MIKDIQELNFPKDKDGKQYATLTQATVTLQDMGEKTITSQVKIDGGITPDFSYDWEVEFQGEKYIMPLRKPQGSKENTSLNSTIDLTFQHWAIYQLKRWYFFTLANIETGTAVADKYKASVSLNLENFCDLLGRILNYYYGDNITLRLNPDWKGAQEPTAVEINYSHIWDVLIKLYELYAVRWVIEPNGDRDHYVIKVGYPTEEVSHVFKYGFEGGLMRVERQVQDENIRNMIIGRGGSKNLPYRYFKKHDEQNKSFTPDPDWIPELANVYFSELHGATFRSYIQGWKAAHADEYRGYASDKEAYKEKYGHDYPDGERWEVTAPKADKAYAPWAWMRGYTDERFNPAEFVADEFDTSSNGYGVVAGSSIAKYGELMDGLDDNEDIYPTIQGVVIDGLGRIDEIVAADKILSDDTEADGGDAATRTVAGCSGRVQYVGASQYKQFTVKGSGNFSVDKGKHANLIVDIAVMKVDASSDPAYIAARAEIIKPTRTRVFNVATGEEHSASGIPEGTWRYEVSGEVHNLTEDKTLDITVGDTTPYLFDAAIGDTSGNTWDIWVKNIWASERIGDETDAEYAERVWGPILGDREGNEAKVVFSDGMLATSSDYEFTIVKGGIHYDPGKQIGIKDASGNVIGHCPSHWRLTLAKSDADLESTGVYIPSTKRFALAGDHFFFIGIDMPHMYVTKAEERLDDWKKDNLEKVKEIKPTFVVGLDKVRIHNYGNTGALAEKMRIGNTIRLADKRFVLDETDREEAAYVLLYLQSVTYTYTEPTDKEANLLPDIEVVLSDKYETTANPVAALQGEVDAIRSQIGGSISNIAQTVVKTGDTRYIRKDIADIAMGRIDFRKGLDAGKEAVMKEGVQFGRNFAPGITGFGGKIDGNADGELNSLRLREWLETPEFRYNRTEISIGNDWRAPGGGIIESVDPDVAADGALLDTGTITLHLEDGEIGAIAVDDLCQGIYHDSLETGANATADSDDSRGNFAFAGFCSVYFLVTEITDAALKSTFRYRLRGGAYTRHPSAQMHFVGYGNKTDKERQTSRYSTRTYERYLRGVDDWEFREENIAAQFGDMSNLSVFGKKMEGYSAYLNNIYMSGTIEQFEQIAPVRLEIESSIGQVIPQGGSTTLTCKAWRGWEDVTDSVTLWKIEKKSPNLAINNLWAALEKVRLFAGAINIANDNSLRGDFAGFADAATFEVMASGTLADGKDFTVTATIVLFKAPQDGADGEGVTIASQSVRYSTEHASAQPDDSTFTLASVPALSPGEYLWSRTEVTYSDGKSTKAYAVSRIGEDGADGTPGAPGADGRTPYVHYAYANSADGVLGFSTTYFANALYVGVCSDFNRADPTTPSSYEWARLKGDKGDAGAKGDAGINGMIVRTTEWEAGKEYRNDSSLTTGVRYLDVVVIKNDKGEFDSAWQCMRTHSPSGEANKPGTAGGGDYWQKFNEMKPIATPLILAENAAISFMQGNSLRVYDNEARLIAGMSQAQGVESPVIYAGPSRRPISVKPMFLVQSSATLADTDDPGWSESLPKWTYGKPFLHVKMITTFSDGTRQTYYYGGNNSCVNEFLQERWPATWLMYYDARKIGTPTNFWGNIERYTNWPRLDWENNTLEVHLRAISQDGTRSQYYSMFCGVFEASEDPATSQMQMMADGEAFYGDRSGANVHIIPQYGGGLPRIECSDRDGVARVSLEASSVSSLDELFAEDFDNKEMRIESAPETAHLQYTYGSTSEAVQTEIDLAARGTIVVRPFSASVAIQGGNTTDAVPSRQWVDWHLTLDGRVIASGSVEGKWFDDAADDKGVWVADFQRTPFSFGGGRYDVNPGSHVLRLSVTTNGYKDAFGFMILDGPITAYWSIPRRLSKLYANGISVGSASDNFFTAAIIDDELQMQARTKNGISFKLNGEGIIIEKDGKPFDLTSLIK